MYLQLTLITYKSVYQHFQMNNIYEAELEKDLNYKDTVKKYSETKKSRITMLDKFKEKSEKNRAKSKQKDKCHEKKREEIQIPSSNQQDQSKQESKDKVYSYSIAGKQVINRISESQLREKADILLLSVSNQDTLPQKQSSHPQVLDLNVNKPRKQLYRYFWNYLQWQVDRKKVICYKCGKQGHISKSCMQKEKNSCKCCLKNHKEKNICILYSYCQECGQEDHISYECDTKIILNCSKCKRKGHLAHQCGVVLYQKIQGGNIAPQGYNLRKVDKSDLQKLRCLNNCQKDHGHFSCYRFDFTKELPYSNFLNNKVQQQSQKTYQSKDIEEGECFDY